MSVEKIPEAAEPELLVTKKTREDEGLQAV